MTCHPVRRLDLFVTERCNLACRYCFAASQPRPDPSAEQLCRWVDWLLRAEAHSVHITLWGGEPLLREQVLRRVVAFAQQRAAAAVDGPEEISAPDLQRRDRSGRAV